MDLPQHLLEGCALAHKVPHAESGRDLFPEVKILLLESGTQDIDLLERAGIRDAHCRVIGEDPQPLERAILEPTTIEEGEYTENITVKEEGLGGHCPDALPPDPTCIRRPLLVAAQVREKKRLARFRHPTDLALADSESMERTVESMVVRIPIA